jgi:hypothetical protein
VSRPAAASPSEGNQELRGRPTRRCRRKTAAEANCGLPSDGADYTGTICLTHDVIVAGRIDRGAATRLTRGSAMLCGEAAGLAVLSPAIYS